MKEVAAIQSYSFNIVDSFIGEALIHSSRQLDQIISGFERNLDGEFYSLALRKRQRTIFHDLKAAVLKNCI